MEREIIIQTINAPLPLLREKYHVKSIGVFGSIARGEPRDTSDIDLLVEFDSAIGFFEFVRLEEFLSQALGRPVVLVSKRALRSLIKEDVLRNVMYV